MARTLSTPCAVGDFAAAHSASLAAQREQGAADRRTPRHERLRTPLGGAR